MTGITAPGEGLPQIAANVDHGSSRMFFAMEAAGLVLAGVVAAFYLGTVIAVVVGAFWR